MEKIYLIVMEQGSYSDYNMSNVCAFRDKQTAEAYADKENKNLERIKTARELVYANQKAWHKMNPMLMDWSADKSNELLGLTGRKGGKRSTLNAEQLARVVELEQLHNKAMEYRTDYHKRQTDEEKRFVFNIEWLSLDEKENLTDLTRGVYYQTDAVYSVQEIELK